MIYHLNTNTYTFKHLFTFKVVLLLLLLLMMFCPFQLVLICQFLFSLYFIENEMEGRMRKRPPEKQASSSSKLNWWVGSIFDQSFDNNIGNWIGNMGWYVTIRGWKKKKNYLFLFSIWMIISKNRIIKSIDLTKLNGNFHSIKHIFELVIFQSSIHQYDVSFFSNLFIKLFYGFYLFLVLYI